MTLFRTEHNSRNPYVIVNKKIITDQRLSWKAKGIWLYAFSRPDDWTFRIEDLINQSTDGRDSVRAGLKELREAGYLQQEQKKNEKGQYETGTWIFYEQSIPVTEKPKTENPFTVDQLTGNHPLLSNESKLLNKDTKEREGVNPQTPSHPPDKSKERAIHVFTTDQEHEKLASTPYSPEKRDQAYQFLSEWKQDTSRAKWKKSDYRSILRWVFKAIDENASHNTPNTKSTDRTRKNADGSTVSMPHIDNLF